MSATTDTPDIPEELKVTDYEVGQDNIQVIGLDIHNPVFIISAGLIIVFVALALVFQTQAAEFFGWLRPTATAAFDWLLMSAANFFVLFCLILVVSPFGSIRLGGPEATPDFGYSGWFAMLFAAGMGIGLMFFGVLEPVNHMLAPPLGVESPFNAETGEIIQANVPAAAEMGMAGTIFHWGLHPWAIYAVVGLALAFFAFNRGLPLTLRSAFHPLFGDRVWGWTGHIIDSLAVLATLFGLATSLGFGAEQAAAGFNYLFDIPATDTTKVILISIITGAALVSVVAGLDAGVKRLSEINMVLALILLLFIIFAGPTLAIFGGFFSGLWAYVENLPAMSFWFDLNTFETREDTGFLHGWSTFYWAWWISWSPFVGMFIARVSYGRTVREFITCVLIVPTLVCVLWMAAFGGTAIDQITADGYLGVKQAVDNWTPELSLFLMAEELPLTGIISMIGIVLVIVFFVTSSDSGSLVIDTITAGGKIDAPVMQRVFWALFEGLVAITLLLGGGLASLQAMAITTGIPFAVVLIGMCVSLFLGLRTERKIRQEMATASA